MSEREELEQAMAALDRQRTVLGDAAVEAALAGLQQKLVALEAREPASPTLAGERRVLTILFCDVKGSTAMAGKLDPEEWAGIMNRAMGYLIPPVTRHDGTVARLMGDAVLAFFGAPITHEDDPRRAVRAGLEIIQGIAKFREQLKRERGLDFNVRVGINTGVVFVGAIGADRRMEYTAMGDTINLAARMEQTAQPGTVQIAEPTYKLVQGWFEIESLGGIEVKGKDEPVPAYRVRGVKQGTIRVRGLERQGLSSPLVGREREFNAIKLRIERLTRNAEGGIVGVIGEAGLGKSRLVAEAQSFAAANSSNVLWLEGQTLSFGQTISYWPFQQILRAWVDITEDDDADTTWSKLEGHVRALFIEDTIDYLPYLASLLALEVRGEYVERVKYLDGEAMGKQIFLTSRRFFERLARTQPTVLVFEDLHWMDGSSTLLLEHLLPLVKTVPLLIMGISRPERDTPAARLRELCMRDFADHYAEILLAPLSEADSARLIDNVLDIEIMPARLREIIVGKAEGNPFFLEEVIRTLMDAGAVQRDASSGRWRATAQMETIHIPNSIQGVIMARVDRLDEEVKQVLRVASVIGRSFLYRVLKAIAAAGQRLDDDLNELQATDLIHEKQHLPELEYIFKHALAQEATYESILLQKRRELHARVAQIIESLFTDRLEEFYGLLAYHYAKAELWDKAQDYLLRAADQAGRMAADTEAITHYQQAIAAYERAFGDKWDPVQRASLERKMGEAYLGLGRMEQSISHMRRAVALLGYPIPESLAGLGLGIVTEATSRVLHLLFASHRTELVSGPPQVKERRLEATRAYERLMEIHYMRNEINSFIYASFRALGLAEGEGPSPELARAYATNCLNAGVVGIHRLARIYERRAWKVAQNITDLSAVTWVSLITGVYRLGIGDWAKSESALHRGMAVAKDIGDLRHGGESAASAAWLCYFRGDFSAAARRFAELYDSAHLRDDYQISIWGLCGQVESGMAMGKPIDHLLAWLSEAEALLGTDVTDLPDESRIYGLLARVYLRQGHLEESRRAADRSAHSVAGQLPTAFYGFEGYAGAALVFLELWRMAEEGPHTPSLEQDIKNLKSRASQCCHALKGFARVYAFAQPRAYLWQGVYEWQKHNRSAAQSAWEKSLNAAQKLAMPYEEGLARLEIGRRLGERAHLEKAEAIFAGIGTEWDLARTRKLLEGNAEGL